MPRKTQKGTKSDFACDGSPARQAIHLKHLTPGGAIAELSHEYRQVGSGSATARRILKEAVADWVKKIKSQDRSQVYVFFKYEDTGTGPKYASQFLSLV